MLASCLFLPLLHKRRDQGLPREPHTWDLYSTVSWMSIRAAGHLSLSLILKTRSWCLHLLYHITAWLPHTMGCTFFNLEKWCCLDLFATFLRSESPLSFLSVSMALRHSSVALPSPPRNKSNEKGPSPSSPGLYNQVNIDTSIFPDILIFFLFFPAKSKHMSKLFTLISRMSEL